MPIYEFDCEQCGERFEELSSDPDMDVDLPAVRVPARATGALGGLAARPPAAWRRGSQRRGAPARARGRPRRADRRGAEEAIPMSDPAEQRRERLVEVYNEASACVRCPLSETRNRGRLRCRQRRRRPDVRRRGARERRRTARGCRSSAAPVGCSTSCWRGSGWPATTSSSRTSSSAGRPGNRDPQPLEIESCRPYLYEQVRLIEPRVVCTLGNFATKLLTGNPAGITRVRGTPQVHELGGRTVFLMPLFHPAAALRTPAVAETLRSTSRPCRSCSRRRSQRARTGTRTRRKPNRRQSRRRGSISSGSSVESRRGDAAHRLRRRDRSRGRARSPPICGPATSSSSRGEVGAGKTTLIRGACRALGVVGAGHLARPSRSAAATAAGSRSPTSTSTG